MNRLSSENIKQIVLISSIVLLGYVIGSQLFAFFPGLLGAVTMYILMREYYFHVVVVKKWKKWVAATAFLLGAILLFVVPIAALLQLMLPKLNNLINNVDQLTAVVNTLKTQLSNSSLPININSQQVMNMLEKVSSSVPMVLGATANMLTNTVLAFFLLYFMLTEGRRMEQTIQKYMPLKSRNVDDIWKATRVMVVSNAIGIPVLAASQGIVAIIGYMIFDVDSPIMWGVLTGVFSVVPIVGCAIIWAPLCVYLVATGHPSAALGLGIYSFIITGGVDNILRFTILKKLGDVHPIITALGIIVGVPLFGFMGFIFGPLLLSYLLLLIRIYRVEFASTNHSSDS